MATTFHAGMAALHRAAHPEAPPGPTAPGLLEQVGWKALDGALRGTGTWEPIAGTMRHNSAIVPGSKIIGGTWIGLFNNLGRYVEDVPKDDHRSTGGRGGVRFRVVSGPNPDNRVVHIEVKVTRDQRAQVARLDFSVWLPYFRSRFTDKPVGARVPVCWQKRTEGGGSSRHRTIEVVYEKGGDGRWFAHVPDGGGRRGEPVVDESGWVVHDVNTILDAPDAQVESMFVVPDVL